MKKIIESEDIIKKIRKYLFENFLFGYNEEEFDNDLSFLEQGILDSTGIMELVAFIEREFNVDVEDSEIIPENLDSVSLVSTFILNKLGAVDNQN